MSNVLDVEKGNKLNLTVDKCMNCGSSDGLLVVDNYDHEFDDNLYKHDGVYCNNCKCFHYSDDEGHLTYEYLYDDVFTDGGVKWTISDN